MSNKLKVGDKVTVTIIYKGTIANISDYRPPTMKYAVDLDTYDKDLVFVGDKEIQKILGN